MAMDGEEYFKKGKFKYMFSWSSISPTYINFKSRRIFKIKKNIIIIIIIIIIVTKTMVQLQVHVRGAEQAVLKMRCDFQTTSKVICCAFLHSALVSPEMRCRQPRRPLP